jgi:hypothetical protein
MTIFYHNFGYKSVKISVPKTSCFLSPNLKPIFDVTGSTKSILNSPIKVTDI